MSLWEYDGVEVREYLDVPRWIEQDITAVDVAAIVQGGCESGAYMPAVTYHAALKTMYDYEDSIIKYLDNSGIVPLFEDIPQRHQSWSGLACYLVSMAVELWAHSIEDELQRLIEDTELDDD